MLRFLLVTMLAAMIMSLSAYAADESLILYFTFDEGSGGTVKDASSYGNDGEIFGNAEWQDGKIGDCIELVAGGGRLTFLNTLLYNGFLLL